VIIQSHDFVISAVFWLHRPFQFELPVPSNFTIKQVVVCSQRS